MEQERSGCCSGTQPIIKSATQPSKSGCCGGAPRLVFACSGASDVGALADQAARRVSRMKLASMGCLAAVANELDFAMDPVQAAERIIIIDGCPENCARKTFENADIAGYEHISLSELGLEKGHSKVNQKHVALIYDKVHRLLETENQTRDAS